VAASLCLLHLLWEWNPQQLFLAIRLKITGKNHRGILNFTENCMQAVALYS